MCVRLLFSWDRIVESRAQFRSRLIATMVLDYGVAWAIELVLKQLFGTVLPKVRSSTSALPRASLHIAQGIVTAGEDRRIARRAAEAERTRLEEAAKAEADDKKE